MKSFLKNYTLGSLACCVMGIALLINPHIITDVLNTALGVILIVWGAFGVVKVIAEMIADSDRKTDIISLLGNLALIAGGIYVFNHTDLLERILMAVLGVYLICSGLPKLFDSLRIKSAMDDKWKQPFFTSLLTVLLGLVVLIVPAFIPNMVMRVVGVLLLAGGIGNFIGGYSSMRVLKNIKENAVYKRGKPAAPSSGEVVDIDDYDEK